MTREPGNIITSNALAVMAAFALVVILEATPHFSGVGYTLEHWRWLPSLAKHAGELGFGVAACFASVRTLGVLSSAAYALLLGGLTVCGGLGGSLALLLPALAGALVVCVWVLLIAELRRVARALRNSAFLLSCAVATLVQLLSYGLLFRDFGHAPVHRIGVVVALLLLVVCLTRGAEETPLSPPERGRWGWVFALFALTLPVNFAISALVLTRVYPLAGAGFRLWLENSAGLLGQGSLLACSVWLGIKRPAASSVGFPAWCILLGAALVPGFVIGSGLSTLLASFGSGVVAAATPLLVLMAALLTPPRLVPLTLAGWFASGFLVSRVADWCGRWAVADTGRGILLTTGACVLMIVCAAVLLLTVGGQVDDDTDFNSR